MRSRFDKAAEVRELQRKWQRKHTAKVPRRALQV